MYKTNRLKKAIFCSLIASATLFTGCNDDNNGGGGTQTDTTAPSFTSADTFSVEENNTTIATLSANENVTFSKNGGADVAKFDLSTAGVLTFVTAPNFENATDADGGNNYMITVRATDDANNTADQNITVNVSDVNETVPTPPDTTAPSFTSADTFSVVENNTSITTITANEDVTFSKNGGADASKFNLTSTGVLTFVTARDFEAYNSAAGTNDYVLIVRATNDAGLPTDQTITVSVTDLTGAYDPKVILQTGDLGDGAQGAVRTATSDTDNETLSFTSLPGVLWEDGITAMDESDGGEMMTFTEAGEHCSNLGGTWRLPTRYEIFQTIDYGNTSNSSLTDGMFTNYNANFFWTSHDLNATHAVTVNFFSGYESERVKTDNNESNEYVRCINAPVTPPGDFSRGDNNTTVTDSTTGLMWQDSFTDQPAQLNYSDASLYCADTVDLGSYTDWRLPTINELHTIVDYNNSQSAFTTQAMVDDLKYFWSSTSDRNASKHRYISFETDGLVTDRSMDNTILLDVRCVRTTQ